MKLFTRTADLTSTMLWKHCLMIMVIAVLTTDVGWAKGMHSESLYGQENDGARPFITIWKTDNPGASHDDQIIIPTDQSEDLALVYNYNVYWEEVDNPTNNGSLGGLTDNDTLDFPSPGAYRVEITGQFPKIFFNNEGDRSKILAVEQWGDIVWENMRFAFRGCDEISINATDAPNLEHVADLNGMFMSSNINQSINHWDVSNVTDMANMFRDAVNFNQPLNDWDVSNVKYMNHMFFNAHNFNQNINEWDMSSVNATRSMFYGASNFNQPIGDWNVSNIDNMQYMFYNASNFNQNISNWDVRNVTNFNSMFYGASTFDQNISSWNVLKVIDMAFMFAHATSFNQDLSPWDVSKVATMNYMFYNASSFDQNLSSWSVNSVISMTNMFDYAKISPVNFEATLQGWWVNGVNNGITLSARGVRFCNEEGAINKLTMEHDWIITHAIKDCSQSITLLDLTDKVYGDEDFYLEGVVSSGYMPQYASSNEDVVILNGNTVTITGAGIATITAYHPGDEHYEAATPVSIELIVHKADQTVVFELNEAKVVGDDSFELNAESSSGLNITYTSSDEAVATIEGNIVTIVGPGTTIITAFQEGNENYHAADPVEQILQVNKKSQSIAFEPIPSKTILDDEFDLTAVASSGLDVVYTSSNELVATVLGNKVTIIGLGTTTITASQAGNAEYEAATAILQDLTVTKAPQEITFEPLSDIPSDAPDFDIVASASSGLQVDFSINGPATLEGNTISLTGTPGTVKVTASQGGDEVYSPAETIIRTFEVTAAPVTGVIDLQKEGITIYPNPIHDRLNIELAKTHQAVIYVSDGGGNVVLEQKLGTNSNQVDFSSLSNGLYFIKIQLADKVLYDKVIKE